MENTTDPVPTKESAKMTTPQAIIVAGVLVMVGILLSRPHTATTPTAPKTLSEQVGVSKDALNSCIKATNLDTRNTQIQKSVSDAMSALPATERGTPYTIVIGKGGVKTAIQGAETYDIAKKVIDDAAQGIVATPYTGNVALSEPTDHVQGNANAPVTIIEYSDFECPYCKAFQPVLEQIMAAEPGQVRWIYRSYPLHQDSFEELVAADCVAKIGGDTAFWKYGDLLFSLQDQQDTVSAQL
jgi:protein-disulfide isomerase